MKNSSLTPNQESAIRKLDSFVEKFILIGLITITLLVCCSCSSTKAVTQLVRDVRTDTVYLSNMQYDSIYVYQDRLLDRSKDTVYLKDVSVEYRYRLLKDTVRIVERDSIPYEVTVTEIKEITRPLTWFDHTCRACFWICFGGLLITLLSLLKGLRL